MFKDMEKWVEIRRRVLTQEISKRGACQEYGIQWRTLQRILAHEEPAGYQMGGQGATPAKALRKLRRRMEKEKASA